MIIEILLKRKYSRLEEKKLLSDFSEAGYKFKDARITRLYDIQGDLTRKELLNIAESLLADRVTETFRSGAKERNCYKAEIWFKPSVTDVVGESVLEALRDMGFEKVTGVRCGKALYVKGARGPKMILEAIEETLANPLINYCKISKL